MFTALRLARFSSMGMVYTHDDAVSKIHCNGKHTYKYTVSRPTSEDMCDDVENVFIYGLCSTPMTNYAYNQITLEFDESRRFACSK